MFLPSHDRNTVSIAIADDHKVFRQAFRRIISLENGINFMFEAGDGDDLIRKLAVHRPDILLLDIKMPGMDGIEALKLTYEHYPEIKVLMLSAFLDEVYIGQCLEYGIYGYLTKYMEMEEILRAIKIVSNNEMYLSNLLNTQLCRKYQAKFHRSYQNMVPGFSMDEIKILELLKLEKTTEEISMVMNLSKRTIEIKRDKMREKSNTKTIGGLLLYAVKRGLIE